MLIIAVVGLLVIAACNQLAPKVGVASPLILLALGIAVGFLPWVGAVEVEPEIVLEGILPPLLFGAAVGIPVMDFRRELRSISALAIGLVLISAVVLGLVVHTLVPVISLPWAIALGAVLSPTDAVAVSIARGSGVSHRIITILEGEGLFNDATALVLLSSATSAALMTDAEALRPATLAGDFLLALVVALAVGWAVGELTIRVRARITDPAADTVVSFTVPFLASIPAEHLGGSGLVAAVVAGLVVSHHGPRLLSPASRRAAGANWHTVELILEGAVFLLMGLQAYGIVHEVHVEGLGVGLAVEIAVLTGALTVLLRTLFVGPLLAWLRVVRRRNTRRLEHNAERIGQFEEDLARASQVDDEVLEARNLSREAWKRRMDRRHRALEAGRRKHRRAKSDMAYFVADTLGPREGAVVVWAGMRGAVTLAAAQTLPLDAPMRPFLLLVALLVASGSLVLQGLSLGLLIRLVRPQMAEEHQDAAERKCLVSVLGSAVKETALAQALAEHAQQASGTRSRAGLTRAFSTVGRAWAHAPLGADSDTPLGGVPVDADGAGEDRTALLAPDQVRDLAIEAIHAQRSALLDARDEGLFSSTTLASAMERLDAEEIMLDAH